jgi:hypothetical protein
MDIKGLWKRHRAKVGWILGISGTVYLGSYYVRRKWIEITRQVTEDRYRREQ